MGQDDSLGQSKSAGATNFRWSLRTWTEGISASGNHALSRLKNREVSDLSHRTILASMVKLADTRDFLTVYSKRIHRRKSLGP